MGEKEAHAHKQGQEFWKSWSKCHPQISQLHFPCISVSYFERGFYLLETEESKLIVTWPKITSTSLMEILSLKTVLWSFSSILWLKLITVCEHHVLIFLDCYSLNKYNPDALQISLTVPEAKKSKLMTPADSVSSEGSFLTELPSHCTFTRALWDLVPKDPNRIHKGSTLWPKLFTKAPTLNSIELGIRSQHMNLGETHVQSIAPPALTMYASRVALVSFCLDLGFDYTSFPHLQAL